MSTLNVVTGSELNKRDSSGGRGDFLFFAEGYSDFFLKKNESLFFIDTAARGWKFCFGQKDLLYIEPFGELT